MNITALLFITAMLLAACDHETSLTGAQPSPCEVKNTCQAEQQPQKFEPRHGPQLTPRNTP